MGEGRDGRGRRLSDVLAFDDDGIEGVHGLEAEAEDIRGHLTSRAELTRMAMSGQVKNGPLAMIALWLELRHTALRAELGMA